MSPCATAEWVVLLSFPLLLTPVSNVLPANVTAAIKTPVLLIHSVISFIFDVCKPNRAGIKAVFVFTGLAANDRSAQLCVLSHRDIKTATL
nr:hypothetical protein [uncultured Moellerella sp.]